MQVERRGADGPAVTGFSGNGFRVGDDVFGALLLTPQDALAWVPPQIGALTADDLAPLMAMDPRPEFLLLGTGPTLVRPAAELAEALGIGIEAMDSRAAARTWGVLRAEQRWIAAALYPLG
jgi:uncharacterized protein